MRQNFNMKVFLVDTCYYAAGSVLYALGLYTFALHAGFAPGGVSGLALIINHYTGSPIGITVLIINIPLFILSARIIGSSFLLRTLWTMLINTLFLDVIFPIFPVYRGNPLLAAMFTGICVGAGLALIYMRGSSTGGQDLITMSIKKKRPHFSVGQINMVLDAIVILAGGFVFKNVDAVLYGIISTFGCTLVMDSLLYGAGSSKLALIVTRKGLGMPVSKAISHEVERSSTLIDAIGTYTNSQRDLLLCACSKSEIYKVRLAAKSIDSSAIIMILEASEVLGEGFQLPKIPGSQE